MFLVCVSVLVCVCVPVCCKPKRRNRSHRVVLVTKYKFHTCNSNWYA